MKIERPEDRTNERPMTAEEAAAFLRSWHRIVDDDGSTVAYVPDHVTAGRVLSAMSIKSPRLSRSVLDRLSGDDRESP